MPRILDLYPYLFEPILKEKIWGGRRLRTMLGKKVPASRRVGESWELADRGKEVSRVAAGPLRGMTLRQLLEAWPREILGDDQALRFASRFPLLVKFLDVDQRLSVQVHPPDEFAARHEPGDSGKSEAWVVLRAEKGARVVRGVLPGTTAEDFHAAAQRGAVAPSLNEMDVATGDVIFLPPGTIHAALGGVVLAEVSQNSDLTYRIHDWGQTDVRGRSRPLHLDKAVAVSDFHSLGVSKMPPIPLPGRDARRRLLVKCEKFTLESIEIAGKRVRFTQPRDRFSILVVLQGRGSFAFGKDGKRRAPFRNGQTFLVPAHLGDFDLVARGRAVFLYVYV
jgi:mannose-6-phosphate isomerase